MKGLEKTVLQSQKIKEMLGEIMYSLQYIDVDGKPLKDSLSVDGMIKLSKLPDETSNNLTQIYNLTQAILSLTEGIKTPRTEGITGALYQADQNQKRKKQAQNAKVKSK